MEKLCGYNKASNVEELMSYYRNFKDYCEGEKPDEFLIIGNIADLEYSAKRVLENYEYTEEVIEEIKSILDLVGHKFSHCESITEMVSKSLDVLEEF